MNLTIYEKTKKVVNASAIKCVLPVRYGDEDIPYTFPGRANDVLTITLDIDTKKVRDWPGDFGPYRVNMKVVDQGCYYLLDVDGVEIARSEHGYVPNKIVPGKFGDYVILDIGADGSIRNWRFEPYDIFDEFGLEGPDEQ